MPMPSRYAGWLGTVAARYKVQGKLSDVVPSLDESRHRLAAVAGTSTCHIVQVSRSAHLIPKWLMLNVTFYRALTACS